AGDRGEAPGGRDQPDQRRACGGQGTHPQRGAEPRREAGAGHEPRERPAEVGRAQAQAEQAEALAGEKARQEVLLQQAENKQAKLDADVKRVADAELYRRQKETEADAYEQRRQAEARAEVADADARAVKKRAEADAEAERLAGEAKADAMRAEAEALRENQEALLAQRVVDQLPTLMETFAKGYAQIGEITVVSSGGTDGDVA